MKRKPTLAQIEARQAKRLRMKELAKKIAAMPEELRQELAARSPVGTIEGRQLSLKNQLLVALQMPQATIVGGFRQWIKAGRCVRKGEHGASIWIPLGRKTEAGEIEMEDSRAFMLATVFDCSQTKSIDEPDANEDTPPDQWQPGDLPAAPAPCSELVGPFALESEAA